MKHVFALVLACLAFAGDAFATVDINTATVQELQRLHGIGPLRARSIVRYREKHGPFVSIDGLEKVPGVGKGTIAGIRSEVVVPGHEGPPDREPREPGMTPWREQMPPPMVPSGATGGRDVAPRDTKTTTGKNIPRDR